MLKLERETAPFPAGAVNFISRSVLRYIGICLTASESSKINGNHLPVLRGRRGRSRQREAGDFPRHRKRADRSERLVRR